VYVCVFVCVRMFVCVCVHVCARMCVFTEVTDFTIYRVNCSDHQQPGVPAK
jgi:hypothetical protein